MSKAIAIDSDLTPTSVAMDNTIEERSIYLAALHVLIVLGLQRVLGVWDHACIAIQVLNGGNDFWFGIFVL